MSNDDLDLVETDALVAALGRRNAAVLVVTVADSNSVRGGEGAVTHWRGGWIAALGLARFAQHDLLNNATVRSEPPGAG